MDSATHLVMGLGLFGLSHLNPEIAANSQTHKAIMLATVVGSQLPDLDILYSAAGQSAYIRNHRGWTHSFPMLVVWPLILSAILHILFPNATLYLILMWSAIAVSIHIFIDLFNPYGTQLLRPVNRNWVAWNIINIFDPIIFGLHMIGFLLWLLTTFNPGHIFGVIYCLIGFHIVWRTYTRYTNEEFLKHNICSNNGTCTVIPTIGLRSWNAIIKEPGKIILGVIKGNALVDTEEIRISDRSNLAVAESLKTDVVGSLLYFTSHAYPQVINKEDGYEVRWFDARYWYKRKFSFVAIVLLDKDYRHIKSRIGWFNKKDIMGE